MSGFSASPAQRAKVDGERCVACIGPRIAITVDPAHVCPRSLGGCDAPECVVPLCRAHHRAYDNGQLDLLPYLEPRHRAELGHALQHLGLVGLYQRVTNHRLAA